jgi:hypothetical protein
MYVAGCSGGGVLSSWVIGHTTRFAAAAVRCPVINWMSFMGETDVPFFTANFFEKPYWEDPQPWLRQSSLMYVGNVQTPTLLMTGVLDMRTPMPQTEVRRTQMRGCRALMRFGGSGTDHSRRRISCGRCWTWFGIQKYRMGGIPPVPLQVLEVVLVAPRDVDRALAKADHPALRAQGDLAGEVA